MEVLSGDSSARPRALKGAVLRPPWLRRPMPC